jgi:K(+)-stimulated pyrophosphate-energized sodium pump
LLGLVCGGAVIYWFTGATTQAVVAGAYRAVEFIRRNMKLEGSTKASIEDSKKVVEICTVYAQKGMVNIFLTIFSATLAFACLDPFFFIGYLISLALFGLFQALFLANAGGAWDNAKKIVEVELGDKTSALHDAVVVGDTVGDPFKDTSSVAMNPVIKFSTLFGVLAVELAVELERTTSLTLAVCSAWACASSSGAPSTGCASVAWSNPRQRCSRNNEWRQRPASDAGPRDGGRGGPASARSLKHRAGRPPRTQP